MSTKFSWEFQQQNVLILHETTLVPYFFRAKIYKYIKLHLFLFTRAFARLKLYIII